jgi:hypothetical protein
VSARRTVAPCLSHVLLAALVAADDALVGRLLRELIGHGRGADVAEFSSVSLPPRTSRRLFAEKCRSGKVEGARRIGTGRGAVWECASSAWFASQRAGVGAPRLHLVETETDEEIATRAIARGGRR